MSKIPNHGNLKEAKDNDVENARMMVFKCRMKPSMLEGKEPHSPEDLARYLEDGGDTVSKVMEQEVSIVRLGDVDEFLPLELLQSPICGEQML